MLTIDGLRWVRQGRVVLDGLSASFAPGALTLVTGPNGAGKTSLLRCIAGLERPDAGSMRLDGREIDPEAAAWKASIALVTDDNALFPELTVAEHASLACILAGLDADEGLRRTATLLDRFSLERHRDRRARELSFGYRKRLAIALSLVQAVRLRLFDEPLVGLDAAGLGLFRALLALLRDRGDIVLVASHIVPPLQDLAGATLALEHGRAVAGLPAPGGGAPSLGPDDLPWLG